MLMPAEQPKFRKKGINTAATLFFTSDLETSLALLPPPLVAQIKALPAYAEVLKAPAISELRAIDPLTGKAKWAVPMQGWQDRGGVLTTASGLLFQGNLAGQLRVFDKASGKLLKTIETGTSILAAPMTYKVKGVQYVAVMAAWGGGGYPYVPPYSAAYKRGNKGRLLVFRLGGGPVPIPSVLALPQVAPKAPAPNPYESREVREVREAQGQALFYSVGCALCHSNQHRSITPDLRRMQPETHAAFAQIVLKGQRVPLGMPRWDDLLKPEDSENIHLWLIAEQRRVRTEELEKQRRGIPLDAPSAAILSNY
jgi:quinohemoprotein ethanol dehydrogenase